MFRLKLTVLYFFTIVLVVAIMWVILDMNRDSYEKEKVFPSLKASAESYRVLSEQRIAGLKAYAGNLLDSDLPTYMEILKEHRDEIRDMSNRMRQAFPLSRRHRMKPERVLEFVEKEAKESLDLFEKDIENRIKKQYRVEGGYPKYMRDIFASCMAEKEAWPVCYFKMTYVPLARIIFPEQKKELGDAFPELFILVESDGTTTRLLFDNLDSSVDKLRTKDLFHAATGYRNHIRENFHQSAPVLEQLRTSFEPMISSYLSLQGNRLFIVVASRIENAEGNFLGAVLVGFELDHGRATRDTFAVLGVRPVLEQCSRVAGDGDESAQASDTLCEYELARQAEGITFLHRDKNHQTLLAGTTLGESRAGELSQYIRKTEIHPSMLTDELLALAVPFPVDFSSEGELCEALLSVDLEKAMSMFTTIKVILLVAGIIVFLIGLILIQVLLRAFTKPFEQIDAGVHEIIGGNFEYSFPFDFSDGLPRSMAQSLTIMKAVLLGLPLPEDQELEDTWAEPLRVAGEASLDGEATGITTGEIEEISSADVKESKPEYYRRLFKEYLEAKGNIGEDVTKITYIGFVEKVARIEKSLKDKFEVELVLFRVVEKEKQVVLVPIKVLD